MNIGVISGSGGKWIAINLEDQEILFEGESGEEIIQVSSWIRLLCFIVVYVLIQVTRFSPDGSRLALGSRDNKIYVFDVEEEGKNFSQAGVCEVLSQVFFSCIR